MPSNDAANSKPSLPLFLIPTLSLSRHGTDVVRNAVHVTDLEEDGPLEAEYLFKIL